MPHICLIAADLRYIQELLGHKSSKTTEIYTHVSMKNLMDLRNPTMILTYKQRKYGHHKYHKTCTYHPRLA